MNFNEYLNKKLYIYLRCNRYNLLIIYTINPINIDKKTDFNDLTTIRTALTRRLQRRYYHNYHH
jgi:hypothetical protein